MHIEILLQNLKKFQRRKYVRNSLWSGAKILVFGMAWQLAAEMLCVLSPWTVQWEEHSVPASFPAVLQKEYFRAIQGHVFMAHISGLFCPAREPLTMNVIYF